MNAARHHVNLLYITADEASYYVFVKDLSRLVLQQHNNSNNKKYFCQCCLYGFISEEVLKNHLHLSCFQNLTLKRRVAKSSLQKPNNNYATCHLRKYQKHSMSTRLLWAMVNKFLHNPIPVSRTMYKMHLH